MFQDLTHYGSLLLAWSLPWEQVGGLLAPLSAPDAAYTGRLVLLPMAGLAEQSCPATQSLMTKLRLDWGFWGWRSWVYQAQLRSRVDTLLLHMTG